MRSDRWARDIDALLDTIFPNAKVERRTAGHGPSATVVSEQSESASLPEGEGDSDAHIAVVDGDSDSTSSPQSAPKRALTEIAEQLASLQQSFDARLKYDEVREQQVAKLYDELEAYKRADRAEQMLSLARGLFLVLDKLDPNAAFPVSSELLREELLDCLATVGIEPLDAVTGEHDARFETVVGFLDDEADIASVVLSDGYRLGDRVIRPRKVLVRRAGVDA